MNMAAPGARKTPVEVKFRVDPAEKAQADQIAESVGMDTNTVMKVMFRRFVAERGFPFDMKAPAHVRGPLDTATTAFGVSVGRLAQISAAGFADAAQSHEKADRRQLPQASAARRSR
jgi:addiction module RelB/DinJ family antitoxin